MARVVWLLVTAGIGAQVVALLAWGHIAYLWVQGAEAMVAAGLLAAFGLRFLFHDLRRNHWPPLLPLASIACFGGVKDFYVALGWTTPLWVVVMLFASVVWFLVASWLVWRADKSVERVGSADTRPHEQ